MAHGVQRMRSRWNPSCPSARSPDNLWKPPLAERSSSRTTASSSPSSRRSSLRSVARSSASSHRVGMRSRSRPGLPRTWCCSTLACPTWMASTSVARSRRCCRRSRSSSSPHVTTTRSSRSRSRLAPRTTSPNRSAWANWVRVCARRYGSARIELSGASVRRSSRHELVLSRSPRGTSSARSASTRSRVWQIAGTSTICSRGNGAGQSARARRCRS